MVKPSLCSPVLCTSIVLFGSGRGISVSENSAAGTSPSVLPPRSTTTPCSVYATTLTSITSLDAAASCFSSYCSISLLISSEPAASSAAAVASGSAAWVSAAGLASSEADAAGVSCSALTASAGSVAGGAAGSVALSTVAFVSGSALFGAGSDSGAGAAAAALGRLSWSENMVIGLRKMNSFWAAAMRPPFSRINSLLVPYKGLVQGGSPQSGYLGHRCRGRRKRCNPARILAASCSCQSICNSQTDSIFQLFQQFSCSRLHRCRARSQTPSVATMVPRGIPRLQWRGKSLCVLCACPAGHKGLVLIAEYQRDPSERQPIAESSAPASLSAVAMFPFPSNEAKLEPGWFWPALCIREAASRPP